MDYDIYDNRKLWVVAYDHLMATRKNDEGKELRFVDITNATGIDGSYLSQKFGASGDRKPSSNAMQKISDFFEMSIEDMEALGREIAVPTHKITDSVQPVWTPGELEGMQPGELATKGSEYESEIAVVFDKYAKALSARTQNLITERNRLHGRFEEKKSLLNSMTDLVKVQTADKVYVYQNKAHRGLVGDQTGKVCEAFCGLEDECYVQQVVDTGGPVRTIQEWEGRWYGMRATPIFNAAMEVEKVTTVIRDITDNHQKALAARRAHARLVSLLCITNNFIIMFDEVGDIVHTANLPHDVTPEDKRNFTTWSMYCTANMTGHHDTLSELAGALRDRKVVTFEQEFKSNGKRYDFTTTPIFENGEYIGTVLRGLEVVEHAKDA